MDECVGEWVGEVYLLTNEWKEQSMEWMHRFIDGFVHQ